MKKVLTPKLVVNRETLRLLELGEEGKLRPVAGGSASGCEDTCITSRNPLCTYY